MIDGCHFNMPNLQIYLVRWGEEQCTLTVTLPSLTAVSVRVTRAQLGRRREWCAGAPVYRLPLCVPVVFVPTVYDGGVALIAKVIWSALAVKQ